MGTADERLRQTSLMAHTAFQHHVIVTESEGRWLLQRDRKWAYAAEIIALANGALFVGGDISHVVFGYGPNDPIARVRWIGECEDLGYYVAEKARIGTGAELVDQWLDDIAQHELRAFVADNPERVVDHDALEDALEQEERHDFTRLAAGALDDGWEVVGAMGEILAPRVVYAHAALARLCVLLREREKGAG